jgi:hypothetical protein
MSFIQVAGNLIFTNASQENGRSSATADELAYFKSTHFDVEHTLELFLLKYCLKMNRNIQNSIESFFANRTFSTKGHISAMHGSGYTALSAAQALRQTALVLLQ